MSEKDTLRKGVVAGEGRVPSSPPRPSRASRATSAKGNEPAKEKPSEGEKQTA
jgi:hypothetical protein